MRLLAPWCVLFALCVAPAHAHDPAWAQGGQVDGPALVSQFREHGYTPGQAWHYARLLEVFASPAAIDPTGLDTPEGQAFTACRAFGEALRTRQSQPVAAVVSWEDQARAGLVEQALAAQQAGQLSSFVAGCGMGVGELQPYLTQGRVVGDQVQWTWQELSQAWHATGATPINLEPVRARMGLRWLRVTAWRMQAPTQQRQLQKRLLRLDADLRALSGWSGSVLALNGRVALDLGDDAGDSLAGEMVYAPGVLVLRGNPDELPHEWLHALDHALSPAPGMMLSKRPASPLADLLATLRKPPEDQKLVREQEAFRTRRYLHQAAPLALIDPLHTHFPSDRAAVEALSKQGALRRDALFLGQVVWQLQSDPSASWVQRRERIGAAIVQGQSDGWIARDLGLAGDPGYLAGPSEVLASHFAGLFQSCAPRQPEYPLQMPTCAEAAQHRSQWRAFFASLPPPGSWPLPR